MAGEATVATSIAILKTKYTQPKVYWLAYKNNPFFATVRKDESFGGDGTKVIAVQTETPQGAGITISLAQTNINPGSYKKFIITRQSDYAIAQVTGEAMKASQGNENALVDLWKREMEGAIHLNRRSAAIAMFRSGTGTRGRISSGSNTGTATITLATIADITNFAVGMTLDASSADGSGLRTNVANGAKITAMDRTLGTLTISGNWTSSITSVAASDYLLRHGDQNGVLTGMSGWCPSTAPSSTAFFGLDRSVDTVRLGGLRLDGTGAPMQETLLEACAMANVEGAEVDTIWMHPRDRANLVKELGARVMYTKATVAIKESDASIGFDALELEFDGTKAKIMSDISVPRSSVFVTQQDTWAFETLGPAPQVLDFDSNQFLRTSTADTYEVRIGYYGQMSNAAPAYTVNISNFGV